MPGTAPSTRCRTAAATPSRWPAPAPLRIAGAPGAGVTGLAKPEQIALSGATIRLPGRLRQRSSRWPRPARAGPARGSATGVPLNYLAQASDALRQNVRGDLTLGAQWALDLRAPATTGAAPALDGSVHVFREKGDLIAGDDLAGRAGPAPARPARGRGRRRAAHPARDGRHAHRHTPSVDATAQHARRAALDNDSPLTLTANADLAFARRGCRRCSASRAWKWTAR